MALQWNDDLMVGYKGIDDQHKEIFVNAESLIDACQKGKGKNVVGEMIEFLSNYVVEHFGVEENLMKDNDYPDFVSHKNQHDLMIEKMKDLKNTLESEGPSLQIVILTNRTVVNWLVSHINTTDKKLGAYLKERTA